MQTRIEEMTHVNVISFCPVESFEKEWPCSWRIWGHIGGEIGICACNWDRPISEWDSEVVVNTPADRQAIYVFLTAHDSNPR